MEPLLTEESDRHTIFPLRYPQLWNAYKTQEACIWHAHEVDLSRDKADWNLLDQDERHFLEMVLAFFASSDLIVNENLSKRFTQEIKVLEARIAYDFQKMMENIHSEMYGLLIDTYVSDPKRKTFLFNAVQTVPIVAKKAAWARKWMDSTNSFAERLVAFSAVEGIFFSGSFCSIYWMKERGKLPGLCKSNDFISRDEGLHTEFAILLHSLLNQKCEVSKFHSILTEAVELEVEFITDALPCRLIGMNAEMMVEYIRYVANRLCKQYGYPELYPQAQQPFTFMDRIALKSKSNFFEKTPTEYSKAVVHEEEDPYKDL